MDTENLLGFVIYAAVLAMVGVVLIMWAIPNLLPTTIQRPISVLLGLLLACLALLRLLGVVTWPV